MIEIPMLSYLDDFGAFAPESVSGGALVKFDLDSSALGAKMQGPKYKAGKSIEFLGLRGALAK